MDNLPEYCARDALCKGVTLKLRHLVGILVILAGIALAVFIGIGIVLVGGIVTIVHGAKAHPTDGIGIAWGALQVFFLWEIVLSAVFAPFFLAAAWIFGRPKDLPKLFRKSRSNSHLRGSSSTNRQFKRDWERFSRQHSND